ncbi:MAG: hypothetical protein LM573_05940 [Thermofilum sp.]|nr:hypothetical protein [Thermofilum sp.]
MQPKRTTLTALLILLATLSFATATVTLTNITEWHVQSAGTPPIVKVAGRDVDNNLLKVELKTVDGTNRTVITIKGYTGDPTNYSEVIKICNKDTSNSYSVKLVYKGVLNGGQWSQYVRYITLGLGSATPVQITSSTAIGTTIGPVTIGPATQQGPTCVSVPAEVLIDPSTPPDLYNQDLMSIEVDVVSTTPP